MNYYTSFYCACPCQGARQETTEIEFEVEVIFSCAEEEEKEFFWGFPVSMPASFDIEILEVFKNGEEWLDYPDFITKQLHDEEWTPFAYANARRMPDSISKTIPKDSILPPSGQEKLVPCKKRLAA
jgi:hypothetical protein